MARLPCQYWSLLDVNKLVKLAVVEPGILSLVPSSAPNMRPVLISHLLYGCAALSVANAVHRRVEEDDTPLPLVIWHGTSVALGPPLPSPRR